MQLSARQRPVVIAEVEPRRRGPGKVLFKTKIIAEFRRCKFCDNPMHERIEECLQEEEIQEKQSWEVEEFRVLHRYLGDPGKCREYYNKLVSLLNIFYGFLFSGCA